MGTDRSANTFGDDRQRILDATDIVRLIGDHLALKPKGREFVALCPFHDDHAPSMCVVPSKQIYHCFSCGAGGNALGFVMNYHKMSFREALTHLAERAGIALTPPPQRTRRDGVDAQSPFFAHAGSDTEQDAAGSSTSSIRAQILDANQTARTFFTAILRHPEHGRVARSVIDRRAISPDMAEAFQLGAAPDKWDGLALTIAGKRLDPAPFRRAGLLKQRESSDGGSYDAFRNRLIFPIHDQIGRIIGFGGRRLNDEEEPKYLNSPESPAFDKSTTLYALHQAAQHIRRSRVAIITEGYMDAIACHQAGFGNALATLGTAMTPGNARVLKRLCDSVILLFDGDEAGQRAAERAVEVFFAEPIDVRIAILAPYTDAKDPDELLKREGGRETFQQVLAGAVDPLHLLFNRVRRSVEGKGINARAQAIEDFATRLVELGLQKIDPLRQQSIVRQVAEIAGVDRATIATLFEQRRARPRFRPPSDGASVSVARTLSPAEHLLGCIMCEPKLLLSLAEDQWEVIEPSHFAHTASSEIARVIAELTINETSPSIQAVLQASDDPALHRAATLLARSVEQYTDSDSTRLRRLWNDSLAEALRRHVTIEHAASADSSSPEIADPSHSVGVASQQRGPISPSTTSSPGELAQRLAKLRKDHIRLGPDPRALPKPPG